MSSWWDAVSEPFSDGFGELIEAGLDRAAHEIAPTSSKEVSQNPTTHAVNHDVGRNNDGTTVTSAVPTYENGLVQLSTNQKVLLGTAGLLAVALLVGRKS